MSVLTCVYCVMYCIDNMKMREKTANTKDGLCCYWLIKTSSIST